MPAYIVFGPPLPSERQVPVSPAWRHEVRVYVEEEAEDVINAFSRGEWARCTHRERPLWFNPATVLWVEGIEPRPEA
jgi:hypothetical protein